MTEDFGVAHGSITGQDHVHGLRNNQDAFTVVSTKLGTVIVVCDGCSSGAHSEVGAQLGARLIAAEVAAELNMFHLQHPLRPAERVRQNVLAQLRVLARAMGGSFSQTINDYFLFTTIVGVIMNGSTAVLGIGDGAFAINGKLTVVGPFEGNAPPYLAYALTGSSLADQRPELLQFALHANYFTGDIESLLIGTDGVADLVRIADQPLPGRTEIVGPLSQFWESDRFFGDNPFLLGRRLNQINPSQPVTRIREGGGMDRFTGLLPDDTTLVVARRRKGA